MTVCIGDGCDIPAKSRGMCGSHYARARAGDPRLDVPIGSIPKRQRGTCEVEGCEARTSSHGLCQIHVGRWRRTGSTDVAPRPTACSVCGGRPYANGLCRLHYDEVNRPRKRELYLLRMFGLTLAAWEALFDLQGRRCPVCLVEEADLPGRDWHVHHDHSCCSERGRSCGRCIIAIVCSPCNVGMGSLGDDPDRLTRAADLMRRARSRPEVVNA